MFFLFVFLRVEGAGAATPFIDVTAAVQDSSGTSVVLPAMNHLSGNFLAVLVKYEGASATVSVSDTAGNTYTGLTQYSHSNGDLHIRIFYAKNIIGNSNNVVTVTWSAARVYKKAAVQQYFGVDKSSPFDQENSGEGSSGTSLSTGNVTTTHPKELFVAMAGEYVVQSNYTAGTNWTRRVDFSNDLGSDGSATQDRGVSATGTYNAAMTQPNSGAWLMAMATFKVINSDLIALWKLDDGSGASATDSSGNGFSGTLTNSPSWAGGRLGQAVDFNGTTQYVSVTDNAVFDLNAGGQYSWAGWVNSDSLTASSGFPTFFSQTTDGSNYFIIVGPHTVTNAGLPGGSITSGISVWWGSSGGTLVTEAENSVAINRWYHIAVTYDGSLAQASRFKIYVNGSDVTGSSSSSGTVGSLSPTNIRIGNDAPFSEYFDGRIDDVRLYNRVLSAAEVRKFFQSGNAVHWSQD